MKIIDLTMLLEEDLPSDPEIQIPHIQRRDHKDKYNGLQILNVQRL